MDVIPWSRSGSLLAEPRHLLERLFEDPWRIVGGAEQVPPVEVLEREGQVLVRAEMAGVDPADLDVRVDEDSVTIRGRRRAEERNERDGYFQTERRYGSFVRTVGLPVAIDANRAEAHYRHGLLEVCAPRRQDEARHGRRVDVQVQ